MKTLKSIFSLLAWLCLIPMQAQTVDKEALYIYQTDCRANIFFRNEVTAISLEMKDGVMHQVVYTGNKPHYFAVSKIQSMSFVHPEEDTYRPLIIGDEGSPTFGKAIDLGLPSGTKWASFNIGASCPEEYGGYYAWGETEEKEIYTWKNYIHCDGSQGSCHDLGDDISGTQYDVAHVKWQGKWCLPTWDNFDELLEYCEYESTMHNGVKGIKFTSDINGNSIFLPSAGTRGYTDDPNTDDGDGMYSSSNQGPLYRGLNICLRFNFNPYAVGAYYKSLFRFQGQSIRPVIRY